MNYEESLKRKETPVAREREREEDDGVEEKVRCFRLSSLRLASSMLYWAASG